MRVHLITGPPGSGKSTLALERMARGDVLLDMDRLWVALTGLPEYDKPSDLLPIIRKAHEHIIYSAFMVGAGRPAWVTARVVTSSATRRERLYDLEDHLTRGERHLTVLETPPATCLARIKAQKRAGTTNWPALVEQWWKAYVRPGEDEGWAAVEILT